MLPQTGEHASAAGGLAGEVGGPADGEPEGATLGSRRPCLLGVERSLGGRRWELRGADERHGLAIAQRLSLPESVGRVLAARGVPLEAAEHFLAPTLRDLLPDPSALRDMDRAAARLAAAVEGGETIAVFGDYDVDGATSAALLQRFFGAAGAAAVRVYIPDRLQEGYGPNAPALNRLATEGVGVIVTVDCGTGAHGALAEAAAAGIEVIVVDHHAAEAQLPPALAVVNPNRLDDDSGLGQLAAVGVAFLLAVAVNRRLRAVGWYAARGRPEPNLLQWLDLVALGTVCDVVPLTGLNRALVAQGLKVMARRGNPGLVALADVARLDEPPGTYHAGFLLGPRVNAGGRVGEAGLGAALLACDDAEQAQAMAQRLDAWNVERRAIEAEVLTTAIAEVEAGPAPQSLVFAAGAGWHPGVVGIVASRLKDRWNLPSLVVALDDAGVGKASGRSVPGVDLGAAVLAARQQGLLIDGGGHPMAAGLTVAAAQLAPLRSFLETRLSHELARIAYRPALGCDGVLEPRAAGWPLFSALEQVAPFGTGNPEPRFVFPGVKVVRAEPVGQGHLRLVLAGRDGGRLKAIAFRALDGPLGPALLNARGLPFHVAGKLRADRWAGPEAVQLHVDDVANA